MVYYFYPYLLCRHTVFIHVHLGDNTAVYPCNLGFLLVAPVLVLQAHIPVAL